MTTQVEVVQLNNLQIQHRLKADHQEVHQQADHLEVHQQAGIIRQIKLHIIRLHLRQTVQRIHRLTH